MQIDNSDSQLLYQALFEQSRDAIILFDAETRRITDANRTACAWWGYSRSELLQLKAADISPDLADEAFWQRLERQKHILAEHTGRRKDRSEFPVEASLHIIALRDKRLVYCLARNITRRRQHERTARLLAQSMEQNPAAIVITNLDGDIVYVNPQFTRITGYTLPEVLGKNPRILKSGHTSREAYEKLWQTISQGQTWRGEFLNRRKDGSTFWELAVIAPVMDENGRITHYLSIKEDITRRKAARRNLRQRNRQLAAINQMLQVISTTLDLDTILQMVVEKTARLLDASVAAIWLADPETGGLVCRSASEKYRELLLGWRLAPGEGISGWVLAHNKSVYAPDVQKDPRYSGTLQKKAGVQMHTGLVVPLPTPERTVGVLALADTQPDCFGPEDIVLAEAVAAAAARAIEHARLHTELKKQYADLEAMKSRLVQAEKLTALGELVAGVTHELNNPLTSVLLYAQLLEKQGKLPEAQKHLDVIVQQAQRASRIVRRLLDFARQRPPENTLTQLNELLQTTIDLFSYELRTHNIVIEMRLDDGLPATMLDAQQIQQVFVNLIANAIQALDEYNSGGVLTLRTELRADNDPPFIRVVVQDNGPGMSSQIQARIFDPFFTTKAEGKGTGLGLSVCHGIVSRHNGHIWVESQKDRGAAFFVELPVIAPPDGQTPTKKQTGDLAPPPESAARILVVDDEASIVTVLLRLLRRQGYMADGALSGAEALERLEQADYDLIICDLRMPEMGGGQVYELAVERRPYLADRFLFTTGDITGLDVRRHAGDTGELYLEKPFEMKTLLKIVRRRLQPRPSAGSETGDAARDE